MNVLEDSEHGHGVHGGDQTAEEQVLQQSDVAQAEGFNLADAEQGHADADGVPQRAHHGVPEDGADVLEERAGGHEVARVQHDGGQEVQEEHVCLHGGRRLLVDTKDNAPEQKADHDEEAALGHDCGQLVVEMEACSKANGNMDVGQAGAGRRQVGSLMEPTGLFQHPQVGPGGLAHG